MITEQQRNYLIQNKIILSEDISKSENFFRRKLKESILLAKSPNYYTIDEPNPEIELIESQLGMMNINQLIEYHKGIKSDSSVKSKKKLENVPETKRKSTLKSPNKVSSMDKEEISLIPFLGVNFEKLGHYRDSYFPNLDERVFFEFLLYRSGHNIRENNLVEFCFSYDNVKKNTHIKLDRQKKLLKEFENKKLVIKTYGGRRGSKQIQLNYNTIIDNFDRIYDTDMSDVSGRKREFIEGVKRYFMNILSLL